MNDSTAPSRLRSRLTLLLILALFLGSFAVAAWLRFTGWTPPHAKNYGTLIEPPADFSATTFARTDGTPYAWQPELNRWRIVVAPPADCPTACARTLDALYRVWLRQGRLADRVDVLWFGPLPAQGPQFRRLVPMRPDPRLAAALPPPQPDQAPVYLIDPSGFLVMRYPPDFTMAGLHQDVSRLLK